MELRLGGGRLDHRAVGREIAAQHREAVAGDQRRSSGRMTSSLNTLAPAMLSPSVRPLTVRRVGIEIGRRSRSSSARRPPA